MLLFVMAALVLTPAAEAEFPHPEAPRTLNYYLRPDIAAHVSTLAKWDILIIPHQLIDDAPGSLELIRAIHATDHPEDIIILAYIDPFQIPAHPSEEPGEIQHDFVDGIDDAWLAYNTAGEVITVWENSLHVNFTSACPEVGGQTFREYFVDFVDSRLYSLIDTGIIDGVFLDEMSSGGWVWWDDQPSWVGPYDYNNDSVPDTNEELTDWMVEAVYYFSDELGARLPDGGYLMGNNCKPYQPGVQGKLFEAFPGQWEYYIPGTLNGLDIWNSLESGINITSVNAVHEDTWDLRVMRFLYTTTLLSDNYFSFDATTFDHYQLTWYDLFDVNLGLPLGERYMIGAPPDFAFEFESGIDASVVPFGQHSSVTTTSEPGLVIQGNHSLLAETTDENADWPTHFYLEPPGGFLPGETYTFSYKYKILDTELPESPIFFKSSPDDGPRAKSISLPAVVGAEGLYRGSITLGDSESYQVRLLSKMATSLVIDSLTIELGYGGGIWARDYEKGVVVSNTSGSDRLLPHNPDWELANASWQHGDHPEWLSGSSIYLPYEDGLVFTYAESSTEAPESPAGARIAMGDPWPNPFNPRFSVLLAGTEGARGSLTLHDIRGRRLAVLWQGELKQEGERFSFDLDRDLPRGLASGVYLLRAAAADERIHRKLVLLR